MSLRCFRKHFILGWLLASAFVSLSEFHSAVEVRTAVPVVAGPVALQDFNVASWAKSWKPVLATPVDAMLVCEDC